MKTPFGSSSGRLERWLSRLLRLGVALVAGLIATCPGTTGFWITVVVMAIVLTTGGGEFDLLSPGGGYSTSQQKPSLDDRFKTDIASREHKLRTLEAA